MRFLAVAVGLFVAFAYLFAWALCRAASLADRALREALDEMDEEGWR